MLKKIKKLLAISLLPILMLTHLSAMADNKAEKSSPQSFTLDQAIDYALANNPDLQIAAERIGQAEAQLGVAFCVLSASNRPSWLSAFQQSGRSIRDDCLATGFRCQFYQ